MIGAAAKLTKPTDRTALVIKSATQRCEMQRANQQRRDFLIRESLCSFTVVLLM